MQISDLISKQEHEAIQNTKEAIIAENSYIRGYVYSIVAVPYLPEYPPRVFKCKDNVVSCLGCSKGPHGKNCTGETFFSRSALRDSQPTSGKAIPINCLR